MNNYTSIKAINERNGQILRKVQLFKTVSTVYKFGEDWNTHLAKEDKKL